MDKEILAEILKKRWFSFYQNLGATGDPEVFFRDIVARYGEPHRRYHTIYHIEHCIEELDGARRFVANAVMVEFALWYHDIIYNPGVKNNEEESGRYAREMARQIGLSPMFGKRAEALILFTRHKVPPQNIDDQIVVDSDLAILGQEPRDFDKYERCVRREYCFMSDEDFARGRAAFLKSLLDRAPIFWTPFFRRRYEARAWRNIERSLARLAG